MRFDSVKEERDGILGLLALSMGREIKDVVKTGFDGIAQDRLDEETKKMCEWISPLDFTAVQKDIYAKRQKGTGNWILKTLEIDEWLRGGSRGLWLRGKGDVLLFNKGNKADRRLGCSGGREDCSFVSHCLC